CSSSLHEGYDEPETLRSAICLNCPMGADVRQTLTDRKDVPRLEDMAGDSPALLAARRMVADLLLWKAGQVAWSDLSRSTLFYGPPGTGKTWLARAMGASAGIACVTGSFAEWQAAGHLGDMLREMRKTFAEARSRAPCILFIDEIDAVGSRASRDPHNSNYRTQVINGFLGEMNAIALQEGVIVVGACNFIDRIDPAVLRAGRFDLKIKVPLPDAAGLRPKSGKRVLVDALDSSGSPDPDLIDHLPMRVIAFLTLPGGRFWRGRSITPPSPAPGIPRFSSTWPTAPAPSCWPARWRPA
ncbi:hypothetical protein ACSSV6_004005, partial [Roseovarius sp. MBR-38]